MIYKLRPENYEKTRPIFKELMKYHLFVASIIEGNSQGRIFVDDRENPKSAFILTTEGEGDIYLAGDPSDEQFNAEMNQIIRKIFKEEGSEDYGYFTTYWHPNEWEDKFDIIFDELNPIKLYRKHLLFKELKFDWKRKMPTDFKMVRIGQVLNQKDLKNLDDLIDWVDPDELRHPFISENGFGTCIVDEENNAVASWCQLDYISGTRAEMGIMTAQEYRRRGLAALAVAANVEFLLSKGFDDIGWHYWSNNIASGKTAEKVGFEETIEHPVYLAEFNQFDNFLLQAHHYSAYEMYRDHQKAAENLEKALRLAEEKHEDFIYSPHLAKTGIPLNAFYYDAACNWALAGDSQKALSNLEKAIENGFDNFDHLMKDEDFKNVHEATEWKNLIEKIKK